MNFVYKDENVHQQHFGEISWRMIHYSSVENPHYSMDRESYERQLNNVVPYVLLGLGFLLVRSHQFDLVLYYLATKIGEYKCGNPRFKNSTEKSGDFLLTSKSLNTYLFS